MPRDPKIPDEFQVYTLCLLRRPKDAPQLREEWWVASDPLAFPKFGAEVGDRRAMED